MTAYLIYKHTSPSGKSYVGKTKFTMEKRWKEHCYVAYNKHHPLYNKHFYKAIRKYGANAFTHTVVVTNVPDYFVNAFERYWIWKYDCVTSGYNYAEGGQGHVSLQQKEATILSNMTRTITEDTKIKMSISAKARGPHAQESYDISSRKKSKLANIYNYTTNELLYENVYLFEWVREHPECDKALLIKTANPKSRVRQHKNYYVKWSQNENN